MSVSWKAMFFFVVIGWIALIFSLVERQTVLRSERFQPAAMWTAFFSKGTHMQLCTIPEPGWSSLLARRRDSC